MKCQYCGKNMSWIQLRTFDGEPYFGWACDCENGNAKVTNPSYINQVKPYEQYVGTIDNWCNLVQGMLLKASKGDPVTVADCNVALERLIRAETLEANLEINGPGQRLYEQIVGIRKLVLELKFKLEHPEPVKPKLVITTEYRDDLVGDLETARDELEEVIGTLADLNDDNLHGFDRIQERLLDLSAALEHSANDLEEELRNVRYKGE